MLSKCVKLILILALVVAVAFGVSFLPFSLSDKFKEVAEKVTSKIKDLANMNQPIESGVHLDFAKRDNYKFGDFSVVLEKSENEPKSGFVKFIHKGENNYVLPVDKFLNGETELTGLETGKVDFAAAFFKANLPHLLMVEVRKHREHDEDREKADIDEEIDEEDALSWFFVPGENNAWIKLETGVDRAKKVEEVLARLTEEAEPKAPAAAARKGAKKAVAAKKAPAPAKKAPKATAPKAKVVKVEEPEEDGEEDLEFDEDDDNEEEEEEEEEDWEEVADEEEEGEEMLEEVEEEVVPAPKAKTAPKKAAAKAGAKKAKWVKKPAAATSEFEETPNVSMTGGHLRGKGAESSVGSSVDNGVAA